MTKTFSGLLLGACIAISIAAGARSSTVVSVVEDHDLDARCSKCGDGTCTPSCGETSTTCPRDCGGTAQALGTETADEGRCSKCGDGTCTPSCGETATSCPRDCGGTAS